MGGIDRKRGKEGGEERRGGERKEQGRGRGEVKDVQRKGADRALSM